MTQTPTVSARAVNSEAGDHPVTADPVEQAAAAAAIRRSWREFPYYGKRYGERGWRFSLSDTGWIQTLCDLPPAGAQQQVRWLAGVLASRGMPAYLLERHLVFLHEELLAALPDRGSRYAVLRNCAADLRERRAAWIDDEGLAALAHEFDLRTAESPQALRNAGVLIAAAVADERTGFAGSLASLREWLCAPERADAAWRAAVDDAIARAQRRVDEAAGGAARDAASGRQGDGAPRAGH